MHGHLHGHFVPSGPASLIVVAGANEAGKSSFVNHVYGTFWADFHHFDCFEPDAPRAT